ncbi:quinol:cytochrome c oxidoreductase pentaheme cytochrome subunit [Modicisalibacter ilicicola DSM 19980]|uniref:Quinol:cytochrome c oxidoreductase pentaheme cytochrome subunit n=1 Tax=Modicisalibacter ilicicola DSM 19980 TaxID=1121942 RepID=A0A1M5CI80_9GAMM|nr:cytochrome c3 family protein [Halomonas ilicicola]SHF54406.1 quinol:cytochrome c oxidoreductase pentaheme cytochrome subunit [Halomonas ilicicola DSM 19980]
MAALFGPRANSLAIVMIVGVLTLAVLFAVAAYLFYRSPYQTAVGYAPEQPVPFSHRHHVGGLGIDCQYCHASAETSDFAGIPATHTCMTCHSREWTNAEMLAPVRQSLAREEPLRWVRVHNLADYVYFSHRAHVNNGVGCESCHGRVDRMPLMVQRKPLTMQWCLECHRNPAPELRPENRITAMGYVPAEEGIAGSELIEHYGTPLDRLTECTTCHR